MKFSHLVKKLNRLFSADERQQQRQQRELKTALKKIRQKQHELDEKISHCNNESERQQLQEKISILKVQRAKGLELLRNGE